MEHGASTTHQHFRGVNNLSTTTLQSASFKLEETNEEPAPRTDYPCGFNITRHRQRYGMNNYCLHPKYQYFPKYHPSNNASIPPKPEILWQKVDDELYLLFMTNLSKSLQEGERKTVLRSWLIFLTIICLLVGIFTGHIPLIDALAGGVNLNGSDIYWLVLYIGIILVLILLGCHMGESASSSLNHSIRQFQARFRDHGISLQMIGYTLGEGGGVHANLYKSQYVVFLDVSCRTFQSGFPTRGEERIVDDSLDRQTVV